MRALKIIPLLLLLIAFAFGLFWIAKPQEARNRLWRLRQVWHQVNYDKELRFDGLRILKREDIEVRLPIQHSNVWWIFNPSRVEGALLDHPLIAAVQLGRCEWYSLSCFAIRIGERRAQFVAKVGDRYWILGEDGGFMAPAPDGGGTGDTVLVEGLNDTFNSPDLVKAKLRLIQQSIRIIEGESQLPVQRALLRESDEFDLWFDGVEFTARFDLADNGVRVKDEALRFKKILEEIRNNRSGRVRSIDLAYDKIGVIRLLPEISPTKIPKGR